MTEVLSPPEPVRGRPFVKGRSGNPRGRPAGSRNKKTLAAAVLLEGESEALTRKAVELALEAIRQRCGSASSAFCRRVRTSGQVHAAADRERR